MKLIELHETTHTVKVGERCEDLEPNVKEDCIFVCHGEPIGFYVRRIPDNMIQLADIANREFRSNRVPKSLLERTDVLKLTQQGYTRAQAKKLGTVQQSAILGSIPPKPLFKREYPTISSVHSVESAKNFVKAMLLLAIASENYLKEIMPTQYDLQSKLLSGVADKWKFGNLFTSSISNFNISAPYHKDGGNIIGTVNVIITKRKDSVGGNLHLPDYGAVIDQCDNSLLVYPAWRNIHGVTPIHPTSPDGYRNTLIFYALKAFLQEQYKDGTSDQTTNCQK
jgi:hypothetical protein